jgi:restriction system protein
MLTPDFFFAFLWRAFGPIAIVMLVALLAAFVYFILKRRWLDAAGMSEIERMTGKDFESKLRLVFQHKGYRVVQTPHVGDWGADLVIARDGEKTAVQAKRWKRRVSPRAIQEVVASKAKYGCGRAMVVTNSFFTGAARELARANDVELWDRDRLAREILGYYSALPPAPELTAESTLSPSLPPPRSATVTDPATTVMWKRPTGFVGTGGASSASDTPAGSMTGLPCARATRRRSWPSPGTWRKPRTGC